MSIQFARGAEMPAVIDRPRRRTDQLKSLSEFWVADITSIDSAQAKLHC